MNFERHFRWQRRFIQSGLLAPIAWLMSARVPKAEGFGRFTNHLQVPLQATGNEMSTLLSKRIEAFRSSADTYLDEALHEELSPRIRADAAFDACYMYCRVAMAGADDNLVHPHHEVLTGAAERLGWSAEVMTTAVQYLEDWHVPMRGDNRYEKLLAIALRLKDAVDSGDAITPLKP